MMRNVKFVNENFKTICISVKVEEGFKIADSVINKALMIAMNYLMENMETEDKESAE
jgi:hypothetical protein